MIELVEEEVLPCLEDLPLGLELGKGVAWRENGERRREKTPDIHRLY